MDEELKKAIDYFQYLPFKHIFDKKKIKKATERNKKLYAFLLTFEDGHTYLDEISNDIHGKEVEDVKTYDDLVRFEKSFDNVNLLMAVKDSQYVKTTNVTRDDETQFTLIEITEKGWAFMERYETNLENKKTSKGKSESV